ncbi:MotE family protein [Salinarimonas soli]|uniref:MotE family protein n=1 Tax=Salinarimonas soli TaxID=1638099 RepID=A0A5B2VGB5_9HYPH|nr:MotE family protein [Salinarimonas soli]KAA2237379.1 MotE family protein [Salinarimonas soli]
MRFHHRTTRLRAIRALLATGLLLAAAPTALAVDAARPETPAPADEVKLYCETIRQGAVDARAAWQARALQEMEARLERRFAELTAQKREFEAWLARREEFLKKAEDSVVGIYSRMNTESAAAQLAAMDRDTASAIIAKLPPRQAGAILNEMEPGRAAMLARTVAGSARK